MFCLSLALLSCSPSAAPHAYSVQKHCLPDGRAIFLHGGDLESSEGTSAALLHLGSQRWEPAIMAGEAPGVICDHSLTPVARNRLLQYG